MGRWQVSYAGLLCLTLLAPAPPARAQAQDGGTAQAQDERPATDTEAAASEAPAEPPPSDAEAVVRRVLSANPSLEALRARVAALEHAAVQVTAWPDPTVSVEYSNMPLTEPYPGAHPMSGVQGTVRQTIPAAGVIGAREDVARAQVEVGALELEEARNRLAAAARTLWHELALLRQLAEITRQHWAEVARLVRAVRAAYEVGRAQQHELIRLTVLRATIGQDLADLEQAAIAVLAELNAAMHRPPEAEVVTPERTGFPAAPEDLAPLVARAEEARALLVQAGAEARVERLQADLSRAQGRLEPSVWLGYRYRRAIPGRDAGEDFLTAGVSLPLPWFWNDVRYEEAALAALSRAKAAEARYAAALDEIEAGLAGALSRWRRAAERARVYRRVLIPQTRAALRAAFAAYQVGRADFGTVYETEVDLLDLERALRRAQNEAARAAVDVARLTGTAPLPIEVPGAAEEDGEDAGGEGDEDDAGGDDGAEGDEDEASADPAGKTAPEEGAPE